MTITEFLAQPAIRRAVIRTKKSTLVLGATAAASITNSIFRAQASNALQHAITDYAVIRELA
jgi:hypothetical protein